MISDVKVSIIISCYNKGQYVKEAVESALNQTYQNIEIICIDDASTDNSKTVLKELAEKYDKIVLIEENENIGVCRARNKAIEVASSEYILPLDADDTIEPTYVEKGLDVLKTNPSIDIVYSRVRSLISKKELFKPDRNANLLYGNFITCSAIFKKNDFMNVGGYDIAFNKIGCEDWELYLSFLENGLKFYQIDEILFNYRQNTDENRSKIQSENVNNIFYQVLNKHKDLYLKNGLFEEMYKSLIFKTIYNKYIKYKKLFNIFLSITIVETLIIFAYLVCRGVL